MEQKILIEIEGIEKTYKKDLFKKHTALKGLSLSVYAGEVLGIVGPNGAGKSTLLKIILGLIKKDKGTIYIDGLLPSNPKSRAHLGFLPENPCLYPHLTITDHLKFIYRCHNTANDSFEARSTNILEKVGLQEVAHTKIKKFSKGMTQRAALACALFTTPEILILDEPMSGLDPMGRKLIIDIIHEYHLKGNTVLFCSHILTDIERICDRIGIINAGKIVSTVTPDELLTIPKSNSSQTPLESLFFNLIKKTHEIQQ